MKKSTIASFNYRVIVKLFLLFFFTSVKSFGQFGYYQFTGTGTCPNQNPAVNTQPAVATFSPMTSQNINCVVATNVYSNNNWNTTAVLDPNQYMEFSINIPACYLLNLGQIAFIHYTDANATTSWHLRSNADNFTTDIASGNASTTHDTAIVPLPFTFQFVGNRTFRFYITGISSAATVWTIDEVIVLGNEYGPQTPTTYYQDADSDGYGNAAVTIQACSQPPGYVTDQTDCDDTNPNVNPAQVEICDGLDNNCDGLVDNNPQNGSPFYQDNDGDGWGNLAVVMIACSQPAGYTSYAGDCDDTNPNVNPAAAEICDGLDNNCNGNIDDNPIDGMLWFDDVDHDFYGDANFSVYACTAPLGYVGNNMDCNDLNANIYPGAPEIPDNGIDEDCNGSDSVTAIQTYTEANSEINVFPNPGNEKAIISLSKNWETQIEINIFGLDGRLISAQKISNDHSEIILDTKDLPAGVYVIKINDSSRKAEIRWSKL